MADTSDMYSGPDRVKDIFDAAMSRSRRKYPTAATNDSTDNSLTWKNIGSGANEALEYAKALMMDIPNRTKEGVGIHNVIAEALPPRFSPQFGPLEQNAENIGEILKPMADEFRPNESAKAMSKYWQEHPGSATIGAVGASFLNPVGNAVGALPFTAAGKVAKPLAAPVASYISKLMAR